MLRNPTPLFHKRRGQPRRKGPAPAPVALTLVAAVFDLGLGRLTLGFDRAVDAAGYVNATVSVSDGLAGAEYVATSVAGQPGPATVELVMDEDKEFTGPGVTMTATAGTGIVAALGGEEWAGVSGVGLPFP